MAKAGVIISPDESDDPNAWLAGILNVRFDEVLRFTDAALDPRSIDGVHDMRVAIRRLRSFLRDFSFVADKKPVSGLRRPLKKLADRLGRVRDLDVFIEYLRELPAPSDEQVKNGLELIVKEHIDRRAAAAASLERLLTQGFLDELSVRFRSSIESTLLQPTLFSGANIRDEAAQTIFNCQAEFIALSDSLYRPFSVSRLHKLRIAGKHLRYAIELFDPVLGSSIGPFALGMKDMQRHLGDLHDCDVWIDHLQPYTRTKQRKVGSAAKHAAAIWLIDRLVQRRTKAYRNALELWSKWVNEDFFDRLRRAVAPRGQSANAPSAIDN